MTWWGWTLNGVLVAGLVAQRVYYGKLLDRMFCVNTRLESIAIEKQRRIDSLAERGWR